MEKKSVCALALPVRKHLCLQVACLCQLATTVVLIHIVAVRQLDLFSHLSEAAKNKKKKPVGNIVFAVAHTAAKP